MHEPIDLVSILSYGLAIIGFFLLLPKINNNLARYLNKEKEKSSHRFREQVTREARILGIVCVLSGLFIQLVIHILI